MIHFRCHFAVCKHVCRCLSCHPKCESNNHQQHFSTGQENIDKQEAQAEDHWIDSPISQSKSNLLDRKASLSPLDKAKNAKESSAETREAQGEGEQAIMMRLGKERTPSLPALSDRPSSGLSTGVKGIKRLTEAERLLTLWAGDRYAPSQRLKLLLDVTGLAI